MITPEALNDRLLAVARRFELSGHGLALLALGSVGREWSRCDAWSDLDFFAIVEPGFKAPFLGDLGWLATGASLDWSFRNTPDGFKLLWSDGIFGEMAVFEPAELASIPFAPGRVVWSAPGFDRDLLEPRSSAGRLVAAVDLDAAVGELLSCLFVGLCRFRRGEKLSAWRFVQTYCLDRFLEIVGHTVEAAPGFEDPYVRDRRFETRYPEQAELLPSLLSGYSSTPLAALAMLDWLRGVTSVPAALEARIRHLAADSVPCS